MTHTVVLETLQCGPLCIQGVYSQDTFLAADSSSLKTPCRNKVKTAFSLAKEGTGKQPLGTGRWSLPLRTPALCSESRMVVSVGVGETWAESVTSASCPRMLTSGRDSWVLCRALGGPLAKVESAPSALTDSQALQTHLERKGEPPSSDDHRVPALCPAV